MSEDQELQRPYFPDTESLFTEFIQFYGGDVVEHLAENNAENPNADYIFQNPKIVAELKTFVKDVFSDPEDIPRIQELFTKWIETGDINGKELIDFLFLGKQLPQKCINELIERASKTIERAIHKANKQIEETKVTFNKEHASGVVFLINDGNYFFRNEEFVGVIANLINRKFIVSSFDVVIYLTVNQVTQKEDSELDYNIWIPIYTKVDEFGETIVSDELFHFVNDIGEKFLNDFLTLKTGHESKDFKKIETIDDALEELKKHNFIPKDIIYKK